MTLRLQGLTVTHLGQSRPALADLSLTVAPGSLTAVLGPSGAGKSTLLRVIAGHLAPDRGEITLADRSILPLPPDKRGVVLVFQNAPLFPHLTLAQNVGFGLRMRGVPPAKIAPQVAAMLDRLQLRGLGDRRPSQLSGGQAQRGALARALILNPQLLLLDEPLSNLDPALRVEMGHLIRRVQRDSGVTTLVVTHDQTEAVALADRIALILDGRLAQEATPEDIFARPATLAVARFFGAETFLPGQAADGAFACALGRLPLPHGSPEGPGHLTIRPEAVRLGQGTLQGQVIEVSFLGTQTRVGLTVAGQRLVALVPPDTARALRPGATVPVSLPPQALWVIPDRAG